MISAKQCSTATALSLFLLIATVASLVSSQKEPTRRVLVDLRRLPEPFTNERLPPSQPALAELQRYPEQGSTQKKTPDQQVCYNLMGCYENTPIFSLTNQDPNNLKTEFRISYKDRESVVVVNRCENCLQDKPDECDLYPFDLEALKSAPFKPNRRTIIVIGGYYSRAQGSWETQLRNLWTQLDEVNVILVGWDEANKGLYQMAAANTRPVARQLTVLLYYLAKLNCDETAEAAESDCIDLLDDAYTEKFYIIGHSLGAHIAGFVGQDLAGRVGRITGLDPAGPSFDSLPSRFRLDHFDARLVDVLHTNAGSKIFTTQSQYGSALASGHIDLWANDGVHQPGCSRDVLGCSHKRANKYYEGLLTHQLSMRNYLKDKDGPFYRLQAYGRDSYEEFHNGSSFQKRCPITTLNDDDLISADLNQCSIPIDFVSWFDTVKAELESKHGFDFSQTPVEPNNYYFYTSANFDDQLDHYLIKIRVTKPTQEQVKVAASIVQPSASASANKLIGTSQNTVSPSSFEEGACDLGFELEMANGMGTGFAVKKYRLLDQGDHFEIVLPFLSSNSITKYEIAKLDAADFLIQRGGSTANGKEFIPVQNLPSLRNSLEKVFPASLLIDGFKSGSSSNVPAGKKQKKSLLNSIARFFRLTKRDSSGDDLEEESSKIVDCQLPIESFTIQPLRKFRRHLSAFYTRECASKVSEPINIVLLSEREQSPKTLLFDEAAAAAAACESRPVDQIGGWPKLILNTVIIGPSDSNLVTKREEEPDNMDNFDPEESIRVERVDLTMKSDKEHQQQQPEAQTLKPDNKLFVTWRTEPHFPATKLSNANLWIVLTLFMVIVILILALLSLSVESNRLGVGTKQTVAMIHSNLNHRTLQPTAL